MAKKGDYKIPFDQDGNQMHYASPHGGWFQAAQWLDNFEFDDVLQYDSYARGRSAAFFGFKRSDGTEVTMFLTDFEAVVPHMVQGKITGRFTFTKRGQNFGVRLVTANP